ncbi:MAG: PKD domain-containing protein [Sphingobacteriales bacterium]|nr:MAG: PKD domain-containing protein [Sphingobacteriales bacterium]
MYRLYTVITVFSIVFLEAFSLFAQPAADFSINLPNPVCNPAVASFTNLSTGVPPLTYQWNFGVNGGVNSILTNPSTTYSTCGSFTVTLTVTDGNGLQDIKTLPVVIHCKPVASFTTTGAAGCAPLLSTLTSTSIAGSGTISSFQWDFGDGSTGTNPIENHTYTTQGCKTVTLIITNSFGCSDNITTPAAVCVTIQPSITYSASPLNGCGSPFTTIYNSTAAGGTAPYTYQWSFPGGIPNTSTLSSQSVTYNSSGQFSSQLIITDANGCQDTLIRNNYINVGNLQGQFTISATQGCAPLTVNVSAQNSGAINWNWTTTPNANPATANGQNASFTFNTPGSYQVCLNVSFSNGCTAHKCTTVVIAPTPNANFSQTGNAPTCAPPLTINYNNLSGGNGLTYLWSFPGGTPSSWTTNNPPNIVYNSCGNYSTTLTVTNAAGCSDTKVVTNLVNIDCPVAAFIATPTSGCVPLTVQFNSTTSTGTPIIWKWNFGDTGNPNSVQSNQQNPTHTFVNPGCYDVRLIIINAQGCTDTVLVTSAVCVGVVPVANFTVGTNLACAGQNIAFNNTSTGVNTGTSYQWDFYNLPFNNQSSSANPSFNYNDTGWMNVSLIVCNFGCCDTITIDSAIHIIPPLAKFTVDRDCNNPYTLILHGGSSIDADLYSWQVTGATASSLIDSTITITYSASGSYQIKLTVTNLATGCTDQKVLTVQIKNIQAGFTAPTSGCKPFSFCFTNTSVDASTYQWLITDTLGSTVFTSTATSPCPSLINSGKYSVRLISKDVNLCSDTMYMQNYITVYGTYVNFSGIPLNGCTPLNVQFTDNSNSSNSFPVLWNWNFGDPTSNPLNTSGQQNPFHIYNQSGLYSITLHITDNHGCVDSLKKINYVKALSPVVDFGAVASKVCLGSQACFFNSTTGYSALTFAWDFGDGNSSTAPTPCHYYSANGIYNVTLTASDTSGCVSTSIDTASVTVSMPAANFIADTTNSTCPPLAVQFSNLSTNIDSATTYLWNFGDGNTSSLQNPFHTYNIAGTYDVSLIATDANGCSNIISFTNYISISGPSGSTASIIGSGCIPLTACFQAITSNAVSFDWNLGDGTVITNTLDSICYTYSTPGIFYPAVILSDGLGCNVSIALDTVVVGTPSVNFGISPNPLCNGGIVSFTDSTFSSVTVSSWSWNFGDAPSGANNISSIQNPSHNYSSPGIYSVTLDVITAVGCAGQFIDTVYIFASPTAAFSLDDSTVCPNQSVAFTDLSQPSATITTWNWNFGDTVSGVLNFSTNQFPFHTYSSPGIYTTTLIVKNINGCIDTTSNSITVVNNPVATAGPDAIICLNSTTTLNATGGIIFNWSPSIGLSNSTIFNPVASPIINTTYSLIVTDLSGCTATDNVIVNVNSLPTVSAVPDTTVCPGQNIQLHASGATSYTWTPLNNLNNGGIANPICNAQAPTNYSVTGIDANGCSYTATISINLFPSALANAGNDTAICLGNSVQLNGAGGIIYNWFPSAILDVSTVFNPIANPIATTTFILNVTDANGCTASDNVVVVVNPPPVVDAGADVQICFQSNALLNATGAVQYLWSPSLTLNSSTGSFVSASPDSLTVYNVIGTDANGCSAQDSVSVFVLPQLNAVAGNGGTICLGGVLQLGVSGGNQYVWSPSNSLDNAFSPNPFAAPQQTTTYTVIVSDGICDVDTLNIIVDVNQTPYCNAGQDFEIPAGTEIQLGGTATPFATYSWSPPDGLSCTDCLTPTINATVNTTYTLTTTSQDGCKSEDEMIIKVACPNDLLFVPNAFTPNGDAKNEKFRVRAVGIKELNYFRIFNRWGQLIWETSNIEDGWDGTFNGVKMPPGVYVYYLQATCSGGQKINKQGNITVIR